MRQLPVALQSELLSSWGTVSENGASSIYLKEFLFKSSFTFNILLPDQMSVVDVNVEVEW